VPNLTVFEMLMYTAELRLSAKTTTLEERRRRVDEVLARLRLRPCAHVRIGSALDKGVSGGQAK
jgi:ABC-type multidrug transport system ATPase subunit